VKFFGVELIPSSRDPEALIEFYEQRFEDLSIRNRQHVLSRLGRTRDPRVVPILVGIARNDQEPMDRMFAANGLARFEDGEGTQALLGLLSDESPIVRRSAISALRFRATSGSADEIAKKLKDPDSTVRAEAVRAVMQFRYFDAKSELEQMLEDPTSYVRDLAADALVVVGDDVSLNALEESRSRARSLRPRRVTSRKAIADLRRALQRSSEPRDPRKG